MTRHGIFIGSQKIIARYIGDKLVWKTQAQSAGNVVWEGEVNGISFLKSSNQLSLFLKSAVNFSLEKVRFVEVGGVVFEVTQPNFDGRFGSFNLKKSTAENLALAERGNPTYKTDGNVTWNYATIKLYETLDAQPVPSDKTVLWSGVYGYIVFYMRPKMILLYDQNLVDEIEKFKFTMIEIGGVEFNVTRVERSNYNISAYSVDSDFADRVSRIKGVSSGETFRNISNVNIKLYK